MEWYGAVNYCKPIRWCAAAANLHRSSARAVTHFSKDTALHLSRLPLSNVFIILLFAYLVRHKLLIDWLCLYGRTISGNMSRVKLVSRNNHNHASTILLRSLNGTLQLSRSGIERARYSIALEQFKLLYRLFTSLVLQLSQILLNCWYTVIVSK